MPIRLVSSNKSCERHGRRGSSEAPLPQGKSALKPSAADSIKAGFSMSAWLCFGKNGNVRKWLKSAVDSLLAPLFKNVQGK
ncbi:MAG: hypothetical protein ACERKO_12485 [Acetanaerobacterium sp.]